jgi:predicted nucleotidyltransferase component of viral defense system
VDLDFTAERTFPDSETEIRSLLDRALGRTQRKFDVKARCQRIRRNPPGADKTFPTYDISIAYQLPGDRHFQGFEEYEGSLSTVVRVEISLNDEICETSLESLAPGIAAEVRVCVLEDILAEKLRALLQQRIRNRNRSQDAYDIARIVRVVGDRIDRSKVAEYLVRKAGARGIDVRKQSFDEEARQRASFDYVHLFAAQDSDFIPFDEAWKTILKFVAQLSIPD